jgi:hypothetical protein
MTRCRRDIVRCDGLERSSGMSNFRQWPRETARGVFVQRARATAEKRRSEVRNGRVALECGRGLNPPDTHGQGTGRVGWRPGRKRRIEEAGSRQVDRERESRRRQWERKRRRDEERKTREREEDGREREERDRERQRERSGGEMESSSFFLSGGSGHSPRPDFCPGHNS